MGIREALFSLYLAAQKGEGSAYAATAEYDYSRDTITFPGEGPVKVSKEGTATIEALLKLGYDASGIETAVARILG